ncbi:TonB-dependent receptor domain-containing protein [Asticcacaulis sp. AC466]|uniref:TonB-dependent receptor domain-containing protein n=1 Tax=Asticcacaulis sp. AC466 TaxID=1282362 RepID=UPI0004CDF288|nr:TonB-dependent receptor [Asticcacaulis sp. AC466]
MRTTNNRLMTGLSSLVLLGAVAGTAHGQTATAPAAQAETSQPPAQQTDAKDGQTTTVTVTGQKPVNRIDRQTYDNTKNIDAATGNAADALNKVPSVNVDPQGNVTLRGNSNVQIYVDGKPSTMMSADNRAAALQAMSSGDISSVEVMTNPGAQYSSEGSGGIINLVMNKNRKPGGYGSITTSVGTDGRYNTNLSGSYHKNKLTVNGGLSYRNDIRGGSVGTRLQRLDSNGNVTSTTDTDGTGIGTVRNLSSNFSVDYNATATDTVTASLAYASRQFNIRGDSNNAAYNAANAPTALYGRHTYVQQPNENSSGAFTWSHTGDTAGETLKVDYRISRSTGTGVTENTTTYSFPAALTLTDMQHKSTDLHNQVLSVDYNRQLGSDQLSTGLQITRDDSQTINNSIVNGAVNPQLTSDFAYVQTISAAYATLQHQIGEKWTVLGGLRAEYLNLSTDLISSGTVGQVDYTKLSPSFFATYAIDAKSKLRFSYSHRLQRPQPSDLNPFVTYQDAQNVIAGNPNLKPQETDKMDLGYEVTAGYISYVLRGYYQQDAHTITSYSTFLPVSTPGGQAVILTTKRNFGSGKAGGLEFNYQGPLSKKLILSANGNLAYKELDTSTLGGTQSATTLSGRVMLMYKATPKDGMQFTYFTSGKQLTGQGYVTPFSMGNFSWKHNFTPKLASVFVLNDPFRSSKVKMVTDTDLVHSVSTRGQQGQVIYLGLTYNFGGASSAQQGQSRMTGQGGPGGPGGRPSGY